MIENDEQYAITKAKRDKFVESREALFGPDLINIIMLKAMDSQIETFNEELAEYEKTKLNDNKNN